MGKIVNIKSLSQEKVKITLETTYNEFLWLQGNIEKICVFSEENLEYYTRLVQRGMRDSSKYLLLPRAYRKMVLPTTKVKTNVIEKKNCVIMIFKIPKFNNI